MCKFRGEKKLHLRNMEQNRLETLLVKDSQTISKQNTKITFSAK